MERNPFKGWLEGSRLEGLLAGGRGRGVELLDILLEERSGPGQEEEGVQKPKASPLP